MGGLAIIGCCGLNCEECPVFIATAKNDKKLKTSTAREWSIRYADFLKRPLGPKDINCKGCHSTKTMFIGCENCQMRLCCGEKQYSTCARCVNFGKCEILSGFYNFGHEKAKQNLERLRGCRFNRSTF